MRWPIAVLGLLVACSGPPSEAAEPPVSTAPPTEAASPDVPLQTIVSTPRLLVEAALGLVEREGVNGLRFRVTNRGDAPLLADLRSVDRVIGVGAPRVQMPLTEAQRSELSMISALTAIAPDESIEYAVPVPPLEGTCEGERRFTLSGVLVVLDDDRVSELLADGTQIAIPCEAGVTPRPIETVWVAASAPMVAEARAPETFAEELGPLVRAASVDPESEIALLAFSYDARPIERFRYDACVALGRCPARSIAQPPGSLHSPAVGMSWEAADAFCATRGLHVASEPERRAIADASRALVTGDASAIVLSGFACVRPEPS